MGVAKSGFLNTQEVIWLVLLLGSYGKARDIARYPYTNIVNGG